MDLKNTLNHRSAVNFDAGDSGLCLRLHVQILGPKWNLDHYLSLANWSVNVTEFIHIIFSFEWSSFKLRCETDRNCTMLLVIKHTVNPLLSPPPSKKPPPPPLRKKRFSTCRYDIWDVYVNVLQSRTGLFLISSIAISMKYPRITRPFSSFLLPVTSTTPCRTRKRLVNV